MPHPGTNTTVLWVKPPLVMLSLHTEVLIRVQTALAPIQLPANVLEGSRRQPHCLIPATHGGKPDGVPGSWL